MNKNIERNSGKNIEIQDIFADMLMNSVENQKLLYQRKESYYKNCNVHKLFNYEAELKEMANKETAERAHEVQKFCESFFHGDSENKEDNLDENGGE